MEMLKDLFTFPIMLIDGENEERKKREMETYSNSDERPDYDVARGKAEYPYYNFRGIEDRWMPTRESFEKALDGIFEACSVSFINVGSVLVPWPKEKFKAKLQEFAAKRIEEDAKTVQPVTQVTAAQYITPKQMEEIKKIIDNPPTDENKQPD